MPILVPLLVAAVVLWIILFVVVALAAVVRSRVSRRRDGSVRQVTIRGILKATTALTVGVMVVLYATAAAAAWKNGRDLRRRIVGASRLVVRTGGTCHRRPEREVVLFDTADRGELAAFAELWSLGASVPGVSCACCGDMTFELYDGPTLACAFSFHHGEHIRLAGSAWGDLAVPGGTQDALAKWLADKGISGRLADVWGRRRAEREAERWREAAGTATAPSGAPASRPERR